MSNLSNINGIINYLDSNLNITGITNINFNVVTQLTNINISSICVFHEINESFPLNYAGWCNVSDRLVSLQHCMNDSLVVIINLIVQIILLLLDQEIKIGRTI